MMAEWTAEQYTQAAQRAEADGNTSAASELRAAAMQAAMKGGTPLGQPPQTPADSGAMRQGLSGVYEGLSAGFGAPVDIINKGLNYAYRSAGLPEVDKPFGGSASLKSGIQAISNNQGIASDEPNTAWERIARRTGQEIGMAAPAAVALPLMGPTRLAAATGSAPTAVNALRANLAEAAAVGRSAPAAYAGTEAAIAGGAGTSVGAIQELFPDNPTADVIAQVIGGVAGGATANTALRAFKPRPDGTLSARDLKRAAGDIYDSIRADKTPIDGRAIADVGQWGNDFAAEQGLVGPDGGYLSIGKRFQEANEILNRYVSVDKNGVETVAQMAPGQLLATRRSLAALADAARADNPSEAMAVRRLIARLDESTANVSPQIAAANSLYSRAMKADDIEDMMQLAQVNQSRSGGYENALRTQFQQLARRIVKGQELGWTQPEIAQIRQIAEGGTAENLARFVGKFEPRGFFSGGLPFATGAYVAQATGDQTAGVMAGGVLAGVGKAGSMIANALQRRSAEDMYRSVTQGRQLSPDGDRNLRAAITAYLAGKLSNQAAQ